MNSIDKTKYPTGALNCTVIDQKRIINKRGDESLVLEIRPTHVWDYPKGGEVSQGKWVPVPVPEDEKYAPAVWLNGGMSELQADIQTNQRRILGFRGTWEEFEAAWDDNLYSNDRRTIYCWNKHDDYNGEIRDKFSIIEGVERAAPKKNMSRAAQQAAYANAATKKMLAEEAAAGIAPPPRPAPAVVPPSLLPASANSYPAPPEDEDIPF